MVYSLYYDHQSLVILGMVYKWVYHTRGFQYDIKHLQSMSTDWHPGGVFVYGEYNTFSYSSNESSCLCRSCALLYLFMTRSNMQIFWNRATPSHHPFLDRFSHERNHPAIGVPSCYEISWNLFMTRNKPNHFLGTPKQMVNGRGQSPDDDLEQQDDRWIPLFWGDAEKFEDGWNWKTWWAEVLLVILDYFWWCFWEMMEMGTL